jgi:hypothetical protein
VHTALGDVNGDNITDLYVSNFGERNQLFLGDSSGGLTEDFESPAVGASFSTTGNTGWRAAVGGESCTSACSREDATCQVSRMNAINSEAKFTLVNAVVGNAFDCNEFRTSTSARTPIYDTIRGICYSQSATGSTCDTLGHNRDPPEYTRLCCCTSAGDDSSAMCPVEAADCDTANLVWNETGLCTLPTQSPAVTNTAGDSRHAAMGDVNGDGITDLYVSYFGERNQLFLGSSSGGLTVDTQSPAVTNTGGDSPHTASGGLTNQNGKSTHTLGHLW